MRTGFQVFERMGMARLLVIGSMLLCGCRNEPQLSLKFEPVPYETELTHLTEMKFIPGSSDELLAIDLYGGVELVEFDTDGFHRIAGGELAGVYAVYDAGLLALAIDPNFETNNYFYLSFTLASNHVVLRRYTLDRDDFDATLASGVDIIDLEVDLENSGRSHNIMSMDFDEQGVMWVVLGDKKLEEPAQDPSELVGKLIRIVPLEEGGFAAPDDAVSYSAEANPEVVAVGLRSPWKAQYHGGRWYIGDVGRETIEEISVVDLVPGQNLGWPLLEGPCELDARETGPHDCSQYVDPVLWYDHTSSNSYVRDDVQAVPRANRSIYVGWIYQPGDNDRYAGQWNDVMVFGDPFVGFVRGQPLSATSDESWHVGHIELASTWLQTPDGYVYVGALGSDPDPDAVAPSVMYRAVLDEE